MGEGLDGGDEGHGFFPVQVLRIHAEITHRVPEIPGGFAVQVHDAVPLEQDIFLFLSEAGEDLLQLLRAVVAFLQEHPDQVVLVGDPNHRSADALQLLVLQGLGEIYVGQLLKPCEVQLEKGENQAVVGKLPLREAQRAEIALQQVVFDPVDPLGELPGGDRLPLLQDLCALGDHAALIIKIGVEPDPAEGKFLLGLFLHVEGLKEAGVDLLAEILQDGLYADAGIPHREVDQLDCIGRGVGAVDDGVPVFASACQDVAAAAQVHEGLRLWIQGGG